MKSARCLTRPVASMLLLCCLARLVDGSAIPMWEFLSRDEKMSHLYRAFGEQVARYCSDLPVPDCNKNLLVVGLRNLATMDENLLDQMDPYQRGAKEIIWRAMMGSSGIGSRVGQETEESYYTTGVDPLATSGGESNGIAEESAPVNDYIRPSEHTGPYLVGPMVIRVYPDGRPVPDDQKHPLPRDEDIDDLKLPRLPSIEEVESDGGNAFQGKLNDPSPIDREENAEDQSQPSAIITTATRGIRRRHNPLFDDRRFPRIRFF